MKQEEKVAILYKLKYTLKSMLYAQTRTEYERFYHKLNGIDSVIDCLPELKDEAHKVRATTHDEHYAYQQKKGLI